MKVNGLAGVTLAAIVQSIATVILGSVLGLAFIWKIGLVGIACTPLVISTGYIRLVCFSLSRHILPSLSFAARRRHERRG